MNIKAEEKNLQLKNGSEVSQSGRSIASANTDGKNKGATKKVIKAKVVIKKSMTRSPLDLALDESLTETFPASDPIAIDAEYYEKK
ncbi:hypothetical protein ACO0K3_13980 [Undibacterium sp. Rencai35W]|uniref:hypothetical protein n=1 Tax=Undibacterium sp. Rencai35W TaxID=3413046 RepID=UPI003BF020A0